VSSERDDDRDERPRKSWRDIDRQRDRSSHVSQERRPRGAAAEARARQATREYLGRIDGLFAKSKGGQEGERLAQAVREAQGTPQLASACAAYRDAVGMPDDPAVIALFLDCGERGLVLDGLRALAAGRPPLGAGLKRQLRMLADGPDGEIAEAADALLEG
jgi:hypothetical protein